jgi:hypothetical protein
MVKKKRADPLNLLAKGALRAVNAPPYLLNPK